LENFRAASNEGVAGITKGEGVVNSIGGEKTGTDNEAERASTRNPQERLLHDRLKEKSEKKAGGGEVSWG